MRADDGTTGLPIPNAKARAAAMPTRRPVNGPGPMPFDHTAQVVRRHSRTRPGTRSIRVPITSACRGCRPRRPAPGCRRRGRPRRRWCRRRYRSRAASLELKCFRGYPPARRAASSPATRAVAGDRDLAGLDASLRGLAAAIGRTMSIASQRLGEAVEHAGAPLDHDDRVLEVDVEVVEFHRGRQPVGVDVHERNARSRADACARARRSGWSPRRARRAPHRAPGSRVVLPAPSSPFRAPGRRRAAAARAAPRAPPCLRASSIVRRSRRAYPRVTRGADPGDDLVVDGVGGRRPVVGAGHPVAGSPNSTARSPTLTARVADVDHELVHGDPPASPVGRAADRRPAPRFDAGAARRRHSRAARGPAWSRARCGRCTRRRRRVPAGTALDRDDRGGRARMTGRSAEIRGIHRSNGEQPVDADAEAHQLEPRWPARGAPPRWPRGGAARGRARRRGASSDGARSSASCAVVVGRRCSRGG